ncbi:hypothetical protein PIB30_004565 [Stylosanthes scabra]|uniref:Uncharacterized protein n=1 Tax=Stylosanthes scabra TaxID=79078 RepID=A0ABU6Y5H8_9FABA|nr:hypothetical protein [Stylosanthes scabra]
MGEDTKSLAYFHKHDSNTNTDHTRYWLASFGPAHVVALVSAILLTPIKDGGWRLDLGRWLDLGDWCGSGRVRQSKDFADKLSVDQRARTEEEHFCFHKNLQCSSDLQRTAGEGEFGPARPLRCSSQIGKSV